MKVKENEAFVVNQPTHAIMSIIFVGSDLYPLPECIHDNLYFLSQVSDLFFIFHKSGMDGINPDKFCNLYSACGWAYSETSLVDTFLFVGQYDMNIFKNHTGYLIFSTIHEIPNLSNEKEKIMKIAAAGIADPVISLSRLTSDELYKIYLAPTSISSWILRPLSKNDRKYTIWGSKSDMIFIRPLIFSKFNTLSEEYKKSFSWEDIRYFISSAIKRLGLNTLEYQNIP